MFRNLSLHLSYDFAKRIASSFLLKRNICSIQWILILLYLFVVTVQSSLGIILFGLKSVPKKNPLWRWVLILLWRHEERKRERSPTRDNTLYQLPLSCVFLIKDMKGEDHHQNSIRVLHPNEIAINIEEIPFRTAFNSWSLADFCEHARGRSSGQLPLRWEPGRQVSK